MAQAHTGLMRLAVGVATRTLTFGTLVPKASIAFFTAVVNRNRNFFTGLNKKNFGGTFTQGKA